MRKVKIVIEEIASYEFEMEVPNDASDATIAELAEQHFISIGVANCACDVHEREVSSIDGQSF